MGVGFLLRRVLQYLTGVRRPILCIYDIRNYQKKTGKGVCTNGEGWRSASTEERRAEHLM